MSDEVQDSGQDLVSLKDIEDARQRLDSSGLVVRTPVLRDVQTMFPVVGNTRLHLKMENMQNTGSFKIRGAINVLDKVIRQAKDTKKTLVTSTSGNFGKAFALYLHKLGVPGICVMSDTTPANRKTLLESLGVRVERVPNERILSVVHDLLQKENHVYCSSSQDPRGIAAAGTVALEILEEGVEPDVVLVCCGGGGLVSGMAAAFHHASKKPVRVYAVEPEGGNLLQESLRAGRALTAQRVTTKVAGLGTPDIGELVFAHCRRFVEDVIVVSDQELEQCMRTLLERGIKAELAGCAAMAAMLAGRVPDVEGREVVVVITGGNVTVEELHTLLPPTSGVHML